MPQVPGVTTYLHGALIGMGVSGQDQHLGVARVHTEAVTANENALIASNLSLNTR